MTQDKFELIIPASAYDTLREHLFPGDHDEHGAVVLAGVASSGDGYRLLVRDVVAAQDGIDYVPGTRGYRALDPLFIAKMAKRARDEQWAYLAVHNHGGSDSVAFSTVDLGSHQRGYPALVQMTRMPVGGLVLAKNAIAGDLWLPGGARVELSQATVIGRNVDIVRPRQPEQSGLRSDPGIFDRQARMFGVAGQERLSTLTVAIVGLGGAGSLAAEMLARLGVGRLLLIDPDCLEPHNLPRVIGSRTDDISLSRPRRSWWAKWRQRASATPNPMFKVDIAARNIIEAGLNTVVETVAGDVSDAATADVLKRADWIVLAADTQQARLVVNAVAHAYLIPVVQVGVKIPVDEATGTVGQVFTVSRRVIPDAGCLWCNGLIDPTRLQLEAMDAEESRRARAYVGEDAPAPSVITLNGAAVSAALTDLMFAVTGLHEQPAGPTAVYERWAPRVGRHYRDEPRRDNDCLYCSGAPDSLLAHGDAAMLPVRRKGTVVA